MSSSPRKTPSWRSDSQKPLSKSVTISHWPLRDQGLTSLLILAFIVGFSWLVGQQLNSLTIAVVSIAAMLAVSWRNWIPVKFVIGPLGVEQSFLRFSKRISWSQVKRCEVRQRGILLLPDASGSMLGALKGLYIHCGEREGEVLELVTAHLERGRGSGSSIRQRSVK